MHAAHQAGRWEKQHVAVKLIFSPGSRARRPRAAAAGAALRQLNTRFAFNPWRRAMSATGAVCHLRKSTSNPPLPQSKDRMSINGGSGKPSHRYDQSHGKRQVSLVTSDKRNVMNLSGLVAVLTAKKSDRSIESLT
jgi:hypothetical protein